MHGVRRPLPPMSSFICFALVRYLRDNGRVPSHEATDDHARACAVGHSLPSVLMTFLWRS